MKTHAVPGARKRAAAILTFLALAAMPGTFRASAQTTDRPPEYMSYQGYVVDGNGTALATNAPKNYDVIFRIWDSHTGGTSPLWTEQQTVTVDQGYFSVLLGEGTPVGAEMRNGLSTVFTNATASDRYVELTVKGHGQPQHRIGRSDDQSQRIR